jgi:hypothetical protein
LYSIQGLIFAKLKPPLPPSSTAINPSDVILMKFLSRNPLMLNLNPNMLEGSSVVQPSASNSSGVMHVSPRRTLVGYW